MSFNKIRLDQIIDFNPSRIIKKGTSAPFVEMAGIPEGNRDISYTFPKEFNGSGSKFKNGDTLFARITPCLENGKTAKVNCLKRNEVAHGSTEFIVFAAKEPAFDEDFIYYLCRWPKFREFAKSRMEGTSGRQRVDWKVLSESEWELPEKEERKEIGFLLKQIDDKISNNNRINHILEEIAQALFKSWFIDFEPVKAKIQAKAEGADLQLAAMMAISGKTEEEIQQLPEENQKELAKTAALFPDDMEESELGLIPKGWGVSSIDKVCDFQNGYAFKSKELSKDSFDSYRVFKMGNIVKGGGFNYDGSKDFFPKSKSKNLKRYLLKQGDVLMCMTDMKNNVALLGHTALMPYNKLFLLNQRVGLIITKNHEIINYPFIYQLTNSEGFILDLRSRANSGVQVNLSTSEIKDSKFVLPQKDIHKVFDTLAKRIYDKIFEMERENFNLKQQRDILLPKLLFGELTINKI